MYLGCAWSWIWSHKQNLASEIWPASLWSIKVIKMSRTATGVYPRLTQISRVHLLLGAFAPSGFPDRNEFQSWNLLNCSRARPKSVIRRSIFHSRSRSTVVVLANVRVTAKSSFGSNWRVKVGKGQLWSDQSPFQPTAFPHRDRVHGRNFPKTFIASTQMHLMCPIDTV